MVHVQDDLALYALGELEQAEHARIRNHLDQCPACRQELQQVLLTLGLLGMAGTEPAQPSPAVRERLLKAIHVEKPRRAGFRLGWAPALTMAGLILLTSIVGIQNRSLRHQLAGLQAKLAEPQSLAESARQVLLAPDAVRVTLKPVTTSPQPQGRAVYIARNANLVFAADNLPPLPAGKAYELWLLPKQGDPIPAGVFKPDAKGEGNLVNPPLRAGLEAKGFAITIESEMGSDHPTSPVVLVGTI